jgi:hypothetical protein
MSKHLFCTMGFRGESTEHVLCDRHLQALVSESPLSDAEQVFPADDDCECETCAQESARPTQPCPEDAGVEVISGPPVGTYAFTARMMAELGIMSGDEADQWKDAMKDGLFD